MTYKFLEHTADIGIEVKAKNLSEAFIEAIFGLLDLIFNKNFKELDSNEPREVLEIRSYDLESLLVDILNEILFLIDSKKIIPLKPDIIEISNNSLKISYKPFYFDYSEFPIHLYVKAVTFHQIEINNNEQETTIKFYIDI